MKTLRRYLLFALIGADAIACSCITPPPAVTRAETSSAVFAGRVISEELRGDTRFYTFETIEVFKGELPKRVIISTHRDGATCGSRFGIEKQYLVFCRGVSPDKLSTGLCSANRDIASKVGGTELVELRATKK